MPTIADIHRMNAFSVVRAIHAAEVRTRRQLAADTGLSISTVATICTSLLSHGILRETGVDKPAIGRPTVQLALNPDHGVFLGVDLAETYVRVETLDAALDPVSSTSRDIDPHRTSPADVIAQINEAITAEHDRHAAEKLLGMGVAVPGQIDPTADSSFFAPTWGWSNIPLTEALSGIISAPFYLDNPLKSLVIAEIWSNPDMGAKDFAVINLGTGVGADYAIQGRIHRGVTNSAGEWGHTVLVADGRLCRCGSRGCVEAYIGAPGILQTLRERHPNSPIIHDDDQTASMNSLGQAAARNDAAALDVIARTARYFGMAIASMINFLNPSDIVITGWVADLIGKPLLSQAKPCIAAHALSVPLNAVSFQLQSTDNLVCLGSAAYAFERYLDTLD